MRRWLSYRGVTEMTSFSEATIRRLVADKKFPAPEPALAGRVVFDAAAVGEAMEKLLEERRRGTGVTA